MTLRRPNPNTPQVAGREFVLKGEDRDEAQEWFVAIANSATSRCTYWRGLPNTRYPNHACF